MLDDMCFTPDHAPENLQVCKGQSQHSEHLSCTSAMCVMTKVLHGKYSMLGAVDHLHLRQTS